MQLDNIFGVAKGGKQKKQLIKQVADCTEPRGKKTTMKGRSKKKIKLAPPSSPAAGAPPATPPPPPQSPPPLPATPPAVLFPRTPRTLDSATPLPPPSMPKKPLLRRLLPLAVLGAGAYILMGTSQKHLSNDETGLKISSVPVQSTDNTRTKQDHCQVY